MWTTPVLASDRPRPIGARTVSTHRAEPRRVHIGWDVVVTPDGPVILEANADGGLHLPQTISGGLVTKREFREVLDDVYRSARQPPPDGDRR
jgi:hypothetical protein